MEQPTSSEPITTHKSFCRICIASCGIDVAVQGDRVVSVKGDADHAVSKGYTCTKGRALPDLHHHPRRLDGPMLRTGGELRAVSWDDCLGHLAETMQTVIAADGPGAIAFFHGGGMYVDAAGYWATRRFHGALRTPNIFSDATVDSAAKWRVAELMTGTVSLMPHPDEAAKLLLLIGTNPVVSHGQTTSYPNPVERLRAARANGEVWVIDPRVTESARLADRHLAPKAGSDYALLAYLVRSLLADVDRVALAKRADGIEALETAVAPFHRDHAAERSGLTGEELDDLLAAVRRAGRLSILTGTGTSMSVAGNLTEWMAWALLVLTDSFDEPGGMWFNPGYLAQLDRRDAVPRSEGGPGAPSRPDIPSIMGEYPAALLAEEIEAGRVRVLFIMGSNLLTTLPESTRLRKALERLDAVVVFDITENDTTSVATHVMACQGQLERPDVPLLNDIFAAAIYSQYTPAVAPSTGDRRAMWRIIADIGQRIGVNMLPASLSLESSTSDDVLALIARGHDFAEMKAANGPSIDGFSRFGWAQALLPDGVWHLGPQPLVDQLINLPEPPPLVLIPRRQNRKMNARLFRVDGERPELLLHPSDAALAGVIDGAMVDVSSNTGTLRLVARVTDTIGAGAASIPHGWIDTNVNELISASDLDLLSGMPRLSGTAISVRPVPA
ncbi:MAG: molybdopterin oxidoreductase [Acidimicrobiia bacterium]|nr:molybdopterin oxidoreductase [Acidimicrobiia bacterium]